MSLIPKLDTLYPMQQYTETLSTLYKEISSKGVRSHNFEKIQNLLKFIPNQLPLNFKELFQKILSYKKVREYRNRQNDSFLELQIEQGNLTSISLLILSGHIPKKWSSPLFKAVDCGNFTIFQTLFPHCQHLLKTRNNKGQTILEHTFYKKQDHFFFFLLKEKNWLRELLPKEEIADCVQKIFKTNSEKHIKEVLTQSNTLKTLYDRWGKSPILWAKQLNLDWVVDHLYNQKVNRLFSINNLSTENLSLCVCLFTPKVKKTVIEDQSLHNQGAYQINIIPVVADLYSTYVNMASYSKQAFCQKVQQALTVAATTRDPEKLFEEYIANKMVIIPTGWIRHAISIALIDDILIIGNRGERGEKQTHAIQFHRIDPNKFTVWMVRRIIKCKGLEKEYSEKYLYETLLKDLGAKIDPFCRFLLNHVKKPSQKNPNCTTASIKAAILGLHLCENNKSSSLETTVFVDILKFYKDFSYYCRDKVVQLYNERLVVEKLERLKI